MKKQYNEPKIEELELEVVDIMEDSNVTNGVFGNTEVDDSTTW